MTDQPQQTEPSNSITHVSGGVNANAERIDVGADVVGRDKIVHIEHYYAGDEAASSKPKVYHNLPQPDYGQFIGREQELKWVHELLSPTSRHFVVTIDGIGGIGKSALALEVAHHYLRSFDCIPLGERFEAIIWVSAKQMVLTVEGIVHRRQALRTLNDICATIAVVLRREDITRARREEQSEVVRNALVRQRTLLVVDNLETVDDESVLEFLRELPAPTKAIITTRHRIDVAYPVRLVGMPQKGAFELIAQESKRKGILLNDEETYRLYDRTGGVPLAMVWSIAQMGMGYDVDLVLKTLGLPTSNIVQFCFAAAIKLIKHKPAYVTLMALSLFATDANRKTLGYVADLADLDRDESLVTLEKLSLVNKQMDRFSLLPLTKLFMSDELAQFAESNKLRERWITYFQKASQEYGSRHWNWKNYEWLLAEGDNVLSIVEWALAAGQEEVALSLAFPVMRYLDIQGRWTELAESGEQLYATARLLHNKRILAWIAIHWLAWLYSEQHSFERSQALAEESLSLYQELNDLKGACHAFCQLSRSFRRAKYFGKSQEVCTQAINLAVEHGYQDEIAVINYEMAKLASDQGDWNKAKERCESVIDHCEQYAEQMDLDASLLMGTYGNLGWAECHLGNYQRGKELLERSLAFFDLMGGKGYAATLHWRLAYAEEKLGNRLDAIQHAKKSLFWAERLGMYREISEVKELLKNVGEPTHDC